MSSESEPKNKDPKNAPSPVEREFVSMPLELDLPVTKSDRPSSESDNGHDQSAGPSPDQRQATHSLPEAESPQENKPQTGNNTESASLQSQPTAPSSSAPAPPPTAAPAPQTRPTEDANARTGPNADEQLIQQTKIQIRTLVNEIQQLAQSDCSIEEFHDGFLSRVTSALASIGGAIWKVNDNGRLDLQFQINVAATELAGDENAQISHDLLLRKIIRNNEPALVQPNSGSGENDDAANPTASLLVVERLVVDQKIVGLVEVFQRPGSGPTTQRGYLRFLVQMCEIASDFLKNRKIRSFQQQQELFEKLEQFIRASHHGLDPKQSAFTIVNEGRRLVDCDRVSFAKREGGKFVIEVVSGLDSIDRRADEIKKLGALSTAVIRGEKPLWYNGNTEDLPPQIENKLSEYVDRSHSKVVCVIPIKETTKGDIVEDPEPDRKQGKSEILGALIFEKLGDAQIDAPFRKRVEIVTAHAGDALTNSIKHHDVFLMPLWQAIGRTRIFSRAAVPRWTIFLSVMTVVIGLLCFLPWSFELSADGKLKPVTRYEIYAPADGEVDLQIKPNSDGEYYVDDGLRLVEIINKDLRAEYISKNNDIVIESSRIAENQNKLNNNSGDLTVLEELRLNQEIRTSDAKIVGLRNELMLIEQKLNKLLMDSPGDGRVVDWQLENKLQGRQVSRGEHLMTVVNEKGEWEIELEMLEKNFGHLAAARDDKKGQTVTFVLTSLPNEKFTGRLVSIDRKADVRSDKGNVILVRIAIDKRDIPEDLLLYGTSVNARIYCGRRSLGYVLFREVYETLQRNVFFWF